MAREYIESEDLLNTGRKKLNRSIDKSYDAEETSVQALKDANKLGNEAKQISTEKGNESIAIAKENEKVAGEANLIAKDTNDRMNQIIGGETDSAEIIDSRKPLGLEAASTLNERLNMQFGNNEDFRPEELSLIDKMRNEFEERALNVKWFGAIGDGVVDDSDSFKKAEMISNQLNIPIFLPEGKFNVKGLNEYQYFGLGEVFYKNEKYHISTNQNKSSAKKFQNNNYLTRNTFGTYNNAVAKTIIANSDESAEILGIKGSEEERWLKLLADYPSRDSAALYLKNTSNNNYYDYDVIAYSENSVSVVGNLDKNLTEGMVVDTKHSPKKSGIIKQVDFVNNVIYVYAWVDTGSKQINIIPENDLGIIVNPMTAAFGANIIVENKINHNQTSLIGLEIDVLNAQKNSSAVGIMVVSTGKEKSGTGFLATSSSDNTSWLDAFKSRNAMRHFSAEGGSFGLYLKSIFDTAVLIEGASKGIVAKGINYNNTLLKNEIGSSAFEIKGDGTVNSLRLNQASYSAGKVVSSDTPIALLTGGDVSIESPDAVSNARKIVELINATPQAIKVSGSFQFKHTMYTEYEIPGGMTMKVVSIGTRWYIMKSID